MRLFRAGIGGWRRRKWFSVFGVLLSACHSSTGDRHPDYASVSDTTRYVGIETCAGCHKDIYDSFLQTGMGRSFGRATRARSSAVFTPSSLVRDSATGLAYHPYWTQDTLCVLEFRLEGRDTVYRRTEHIDYIVGSGQHTNSHLTDRNGYLYQAPLTYYTQKGLWDLPPGFEHGHNSRFGRKIELECMSCHNAFPDMVEGSENKYSRIPGGIDCERCHGPGSAHVRAKSSGQIVDISKEIDYTIVNPAKLSIDLQLDICQRCHIQGNAVLNPQKSFYDFRPGMRLSDVMHVFMPVYKGQEDEHIMASHAERLKMSRCFIESKAEADRAAGAASSLRPYEQAMTCVTCHNPHISVRVTGKEVFNAACRKCHSPSGQGSGSLPVKDCSASAKERQAAGDNCVSCHMPKNSTIDIPHVITTDHYIRKPVPAAQVSAIREFIRLACINDTDPGPRARARAYLAYYEKFDHRPSYLDSAKTYLPDLTLTAIDTNFDDLVHWAYLAEKYDVVLSYINKFPDRGKGRKSYSNEDAWTAYRIGESAAQRSDQRLALKYFRKAVDLAPFVGEFRNKLAAIQVETGDPKAAGENLDFILHENPADVQAMINKGFLLMNAEHDVRGALALYDRALALDPGNEQALLNKAGTLVMLQRPEEAKKCILAVLKGNPDQLKARMMLRALSDLR
jgi:tetratricopeptide (TPR) repeat protein